MGCIETITYQSHGTGIVYGQVSKASLVGGQLANEFRCSPVDKFYLPGVTNVHIEGSKLRMNYNDWDFLPHHMNLRRLNLQSITSDPQHKASRLPWSLSTHHVSRVSLSIFTVMSTTNYQDLIS